MTKNLLHLAPTENASIYHTLVGKALTADRFALDAFPVLSELPIVEQWAASHPRVLLGRGAARQALLRRAVAEVAASYADADDASLGQIAAYVRLRYQGHQSVVAIAQQWHLHRSYVSRRLSRRALQVITRRFLQLVEGVRWSMNEHTTTQTG